MDNGVIQIAVIEKCYKSRKYKKMYQELYDELPDKWAVAL